MWGLIAMHDISPGTYLLDYIGKVTTDKISVKDDKDCGIINLKNKKNIKSKE